MAVLHDYECAAHGRFESFEQKCPHGCSAAFVKLVFLKPVGIKSNKTKVADAALRNLANDFGLTNVGSNGGESVRDYVRRGQSMDPNNKNLNFAPLWHDVPHAAAGFSQTQDARVPVVDPQAAIGGSTAQGENAVARTFGASEQGALRPGDTHVSGIPRPRAMIDPKLVYRPTEMPDAPP